MRDRFEYSSGARVSRAGLVGYPHGGAGGWSPWVHEGAVVGD